MLVGEGGRGPVRLVFIVVLVVLLIVVVVAHVRHWGLHAGAAVVRVVGAGGHGAVGAAVTAKQRKRQAEIREGGAKDLLPVTSERELKPAGGVTRSVGRGASSDVHVTDGAFGHLWMKERKCLHQD